MDRIHHHVQVKLDDGREVEALWGDKFQEALERHPKIRERFERDGVLVVDDAARSAEQQRVNLDRCMAIARRLA